MSDLRKLYREASHYLGGQLASLALGFISFPVFTRALTVADYGMMCLAFQISAMAAVLSKMGLQNAIQRFYPECAASPQPECLRKFWSTLLIAAALLATTVAAVFLFGLQMAPAAVISSASRRILFIAGGLIFVRGFQPIIMNFLRAQRRTKAFNGYDVLAKATSIAFVCLLLFTWSRSVRAVLIGTVVVEFAAILVLIVVIVPKRSVSLGSFDRTLLRTYIAFGLPLAGCELAAVILDSGDRILVQHYLGFEAVGYYSCAYNITNYIAMLLMYPVNLAVVPIYMTMWQSRGPEETARFLSRALDNFIMAVVCVLAGVSVTARSAVIILGSQKLQQASSLLPVLVLGVMLYTLHMFFNAGLIIHKKTGTMLTIVSLAALFNVLLNIELIPRIGLQGAAIATLVSYAVFLGLIARASLAVLPLRVNWWACSRYLIAGGCGVLVASRFQLSSHALNFLVRGTACLAAYIGVLYAIDHRVRLFINTATSKMETFHGKAIPRSGPSNVPVEQPLANAGSD